MTEIYDNLPVSDGEINEKNFNDAVKEFNDLVNELEFGNRPVLSSDENKTTEICASIPDGEFIDGEKSFIKISYPYDGDNQFKSLFNSVSFVNGETGKTVNMSLSMGRSCIPFLYSTENEEALNRTYVPYKSKFYKLDPDVKKNIIDEYVMGVSISKIAKKYDLKYKTLMSWKNKGMLV